MREIKFRAWDSAAEVMHYGKRELFDDSLGFRFEHFECDEPVFMQYTGITGLDGVEICEGDVVKGFYYEGGKYRRFIGAVEFVAPSFEAVGVKQYANRNYPLHGGVKVIGNIHEHPHLLEDGIDEIGSAFDNGKTITVKGRNMGHYAPKLSLDPLEGDE
jgi:uncharacterized phage protein (TIGR01671 family)